MRTIEPSTELVHPEQFLVVVILGHSNSFLLDRRPMQTGFLCFVSRGISCFKSFNQILASLQGFGALNAASVSLDDERNTTEQLIRGVVYFRIRIAPPPPMQEINGVFEFDVQGFEASLA